MGIFKKKRNNKRAINPERRDILIERKKFRKALKKHKRKIKAVSDIRQDVVDGNINLGKETNLARKLFWFLGYLERTLQNGKNGVVNPKMISVSKYPNSELKKFIKEKHKVLQDHKVLLKNNSRILEYNFRTLNGPYILAYATDLITRGRLSVPIKGGSPYEYHFPVFIFEKFGNRRLVFEADLRCFVDGEGKHYSRSHIEWLLPGRWLIFLMNKIFSAKSIGSRKKSFRNRNEKENKQIS